MLAVIELLNSETHSFYSQCRFFLPLLHDGARIHESERKRERDRERRTETETETDRQTDKERERGREKEREREREREGGGEKGGKRKSNRKLLSFARVNYHPDQQRSSSCVNSLLVYFSVLLGMTTDIERRKLKMCCKN